MDVYLDIIEASFSIHPPFKYKIWKFWYLDAYYGH